MGRRITGLAITSAVALLVVVGGFSISFDSEPYPAAFASIAMAADGQHGEVIETQSIRISATLAGLSWSGSPPTAAWVRASSDGVKWTEWLPLGLSPDHGPDPGSVEARFERPASDPAYFGPSEFVQYRIQPSNPDMGEDALNEFRAEVIDTTGRRLPVKDRVLRFLGSIRLDASSNAGATPNQPTFVTRDQWGADQCLRNTKPRVLPQVRRVETMIVHHAGNNDYASGQEAKDLVYAICNYHVQVNGWWDIAYNALVDKYGVVYEGRRGGLDQPVRGGHTRGFNYVSTGVALLGNFQPSYDGASTPDAAQLDALVDYATWKLDQHHVNPIATVSVVSQGSSRYPEGETVVLDRIAGHRDASATACPGDFCYDELHTIRGDVHHSGGLKMYADFSNFDPIHGSSSGYSIGTLRLFFTESTQWNVSITQRLGPVVYEDSGSGWLVDVTWDGTESGTPLPPGPYKVEVTAPGFTPLEQWIQLGDYGWPFVDDEGSYAEDNIESLWNRGLTEGCTWSTFCPSDLLSRAEIAVFTARAMDAGEQLPSYQGYFLDVAPGQWYTSFVEYLWEVGVAAHDGNGNFLPDQAAARSTVTIYAIKAIGESANLPEYQGYFTDVPEGAWYTPYVERAYELEIARGYPDGTFRPLSTVTREEASAFLMRAFE